MTVRKRIDSATVFDLHPHRLLILLAAVLGAGLVQLLIVLAAGVNALELVVFAAALAVLLIDATGIGAHILTIITALGWVWAGTRGVDGFTLVAALALLLNHGCATLAAHGHPGAPVGRAVLVRWGTRTCVVGALTALTWIVALVLAHTGVAAGGYLSVAGLCGLAGVALWWRRQLTSTDTDL
ncbi:hypothetical protein V3G39_07410 [Dermatophilaceae bacterium Sec6.4]|nr:hypothetical protein [Actinomycetota bacterium]